MIDRSARFSWATAQLILNEDGMKGCIDYLISKRQPVIFVALHSASPGVLVNPKSLEDGQFYSGKFDGSWCVIHRDTGLTAAYGPTRRLAIENFESKFTGEYGQKLLSSMCRQNPDFHKKMRETYGLNEVLA